MRRLAQIWRHPVKGVGAEPLQGAALAEGRPLPGDRAFAILTGEAEDTGAWQRCTNFARGCYGPGLMAVTARGDGARFTFSHPALDDLSVTLPDEGAALVDWIAPIYPAARPAPRELVTAPDIGMADVDFASISIMGLAALDALSAAAGQPMDKRRFRGNLWVEGLEPFEELDLVGRRLRIGTAELEVVQPIERCRATEANPDTGERDVDTLRVLRETFGHRDFGVAARVIRAGQIAAGDRVEVL